MWDVTVTDTVAASYLNAPSHTAGSAAEAAAGLAEGGEERCDFTNYLFSPPAFETFGPINQAGCDFRSLLGNRLPLKST